MAGKPKSSKIKEITDNLTKGKDNTVTVKKSRGQLKVNKSSSNAGSRADTLKGKTNQANVKKIHESLGSSTKSSALASKAALAEVGKVAAAVVTAASVETASTTFASDSTNKLSKLGYSKADIKNLQKLSAIDPSFVNQLLKYGISPDQLAKLMSNKDFNSANIGKYLETLGQLGLNDDASVNALIEQVNKNPNTPIDNLVGYIDDFLNAAKNKAVKETEDKSGRGAAGAGSSSGPSVVTSNAAAASQQASKEAQQNMMKEYQNQLNQMLQDLRKKQQDAVNAQKAAAEEALKKQASLAAAKQAQDLIVAQQKSQIQADLAPGIKVDDLATPDAIKNQIAALNKNPNTKLNLDAAIIPPGTIPLAVGSTKAVVNVEVVATLQDGTKAVFHVPVNITKNPDAVLNEYKADLIKLISNLPQFKNDPGAKAAVVAQIQNAATKDSALAIYDATRIQFSAVANPDAATSGFSSFNEQGAASATTPPIKEINVNSLVPEEQVKNQIRQIAAPVFTAPVEREQKVTPILPTGWNVFPPGVEEKKLLIQVQLQGQPFAAFVYLNVKHDQLNALQQEFLKKLEGLNLPPTQLNAYKDRLLGAQKKDAPAIYEEAKKDNDRAKLEAYSQWWAVHGSPVIGLTNEKQDITAPSDNWTKIVNALQLVNNPAVPEGITVTYKSTSLPQYGHNYGSVVVVLQAGAATKEITVSIAFTQVRSGAEYNTWSPHPDQITVDNPSTIITESQFGPVVGLLPNLHFADVTIPPVAPEDRSATVIFKIYDAKNPNLTHDVQIQVLFTQTKSQHEFHEAIKNLQANTAGGVYKSPFDVDIASLTNRLQETHIISHNYQVSKIEYLDAKGDVITKWDAFSWEDTDNKQRIRVTISFDNQEEVVTLAPGSLIFTNSKARYINSLMPAVINWPVADDADTSAQSQSWLDAVRASMPKLDDLKGLNPADIHILVNKTINHTTGTGGSDRYENEVSFSVGTNSTIQIIKVNLIKKLSPELSNALLHINPISHTTTGATQFSSTASNGVVSQGSRSQLENDLTKQLNADHPELASSGATVRVIVPQTSDPDLLNVDPNAHDIVVPVKIEVTDSQGNSVTSESMFPMHLSKSKAEESVDAWEFKQGDSKDFQLPKGSNPNQLPSPTDVLNWLNLHSNGAPLPGNTVLLFQNVRKASAGQDKSVVEIVIKVGIYTRILGDYSLKSDITVAEWGLGQFKNEVTQNGNADSMQYTSDPNDPIDMSKIQNSLGTLWSQTLAKYLPDYDTSLPLADRTATFELVNPIATVHPGDSSASAIIRVTSHGKSVEIPFTLSFPRKAGEVFFDSFKPNFSSSPNSPSTSDFPALAIKQGIINIDDLSNYFGSSAVVTVEVPSGLDSWRTQSPDSTTIEISYVIKVVIGGDTFTKTFNSLVSFQHTYNYTLLQTINNNGPLVDRLDPNKPANTLNNADFTSVILKGLSVEAAPLKAGLRFEVIEFPDTSVRKSDYTARILVYMDGTDKSTQGVTVVVKLDSNVSVSLAQIMSIDNQHDISCELSSPALVNDVGQRAALYDAFLKSSSIRALLPDIKDIKGGAGGITVTSTTPILDDSKKASIRISFVYEKDAGNGKIETKVVTFDADVNFLYSTTEYQLNMWNPHAGNPQLQILDLPDAFQTTFTTKEIHDADPLWPDNTSFVYEFVSNDATHPYKAPVGDEKIGTGYIKITATNGATVFRQVQLVFKHSFNEQILENWKAKFSAAFAQSIVAHSTFDIMDLSGGPVQGDKDFITSNADAATPNDGPGYRLIKAIHDYYIQPANINKLPNEWKEIFDPHGTKGLSNTQIVEMITWKNIVTDQNLASFEPISGLPKPVDAEKGNSQVANFHYVIRPDSSLSLAELNVDVKVKTEQSYAMSYLDVVKQTANTKYTPEGKTTEGTYIVLHGIDPTIGHGANVQAQEQSLATALSNAFTKDADPTSENPFETWYNEGGLSAQIVPGTVHPAEGTGHVLLFEVVFQYQDGTTAKDLNKGSPIKFAVEFKDSFYEYALNGFTWPPKGVTLPPTVSPSPTQTSIQAFKDALKAQLSLFGPNVNVELTNGAGQPLQINDIFPTLDSSKEVTLPHVKFIINPGGALPAIEKTFDGVKVNYASNLNQFTITEFEKKYNEAATEQYKKAHAGVAPDPSLALKYLLDLSADNTVLTDAVKPIDAAKLLDLLKGRSDLMFNSKTLIPSGAVIDPTSFKYIPPVGLTSNTGTIEFKLKMGPLLSVKFTIEVRFSKTLGEAKIDTFIKANPGKPHVATGTGTGAASSTGTGAASGTGTTSGSTTGQTLDPTELVFTGQATDVSLINKDALVAAIKAARLTPTFPASAITKIVVESLLGANVRTEDFNKFPISIKIYFNTSAGVETTTPLVWNNVLAVFSKSLHQTVLDRLASDGSWELPPTIVAPTLVSPFSEVTATELMEWAKHVDVVVGTNIPLNQKLNQILAAIKAALPTGDPSNPEIVIERVTDPNNPAATVSSYIKPGFDDTGALAADLSSNSGTVKIRIKLGTTLFPPVGTEPIIMNIKFGKTAADEWSNMFLQSIKGNSHYNAHSSDFDGKSNPIPDPNNAGTNLQHERLEFTGLPADFKITDDFGTLTDKQLKFILEQLNLDAASLSSLKLLIPDSSPSKSLDAPTGWSIRVSSSVKEPAIGSRSHVELDLKFTIVDVNGATIKEFTVATRFRFSATYDQLLLDALANTKLPKILDTTQYTNPYDPQLITEIPATSPPGGQATELVNENTRIADMIMAFWGTSANKLKGWFPDNPSAKVVVTSITKSPDANYADVTFVVQITDPTTKSVSQSPTINFKLNFRNSENKVILNDIQRNFQLKERNDILTHLISSPSVFDDNHRASDPAGYNAAMKALEDFYFKNINGASPFITNHATPPAKLHIVGVRLASQDTASQAADLEITFRLGEIDVNEKFDANDPNALRSNENRVTISSVQFQRSIMEGLFADIPPTIVPIGTTGAHRVYATKPVTTTLDIFGEPQIKSALFELFGKNFPLTSFTIQAQGKIDSSSKTASYTVTIQIPGTLPGQANSQKVITVTFGTSVNDDSLEFLKLPTPSPLSFDKPSDVNAATVQAAVLGQPAFNAIISKLTTAKAGSFDYQVEDLRVTGDNSHTASARLLVRFTPKDGTAQVSVNLDLTIILAHTKNEEELEWANAKIAAETALAASYNTVSSLTDYNKVTPASLDALVAKMLASLKKDHPDTAFEITPVLNALGNVDVDKATLSDFKNTGTAFFRIGIAGSPTAGSKSVVVKLEFTKNYGLFLLEKLKKDLENNDKKAIEAVDPSFTSMGSTDKVAVLTPVDTSIFDAEKASTMTPQQILEWLRRSGNYASLFPTLGDYSALTVAFAPNTPSIPAVVGSEKTTKFTIRLTYTGTDAKGQSVTANVDINVALQFATSAFKQKLDNFNPSQTIQMNANLDNLDLAHMNTYWPAYPLLPGMTFKIKAGEAAGLSPNSKDATQVKTILIISYEGFDKEYAVTLNYPRSTNAKELENWVSTSLKGTANGLPVNSEYIPARNVLNVDFTGKHTATSGSTVTNILLNTPSENITAEFIENYLRNDQYKANHIALPSDFSVKIINSTTAAHDSKTRTFTIRILHGGSQSEDITLNITFKKSLDEQKIENLLADWASKNTDVSKEGGGTANTVDTLDVLAGTVATSATLSKAVSTANTDQASVEKALTNAISLLIPSNVKVVVTVNAASAGAPIVATFVLTDTLTGSVHSVTKNISGLGSFVNGGSIATGVETVGTRAPFLTPTVYKMSDINVDSTDPAVLIQYIKNSLGAPQDIQLSITAQDIYPDTNDKTNHTKIATLTLSIPSSDPNSSPTTVAITIKLVFTDDINHANTIHDFNNFLNHISDYQTRYEHLKTIRDAGTPALSTEEAKEYNRLSEMVNPGPNQEFTKDVSITTTKEITINVSPTEIDLLNLLKTSGGTIAPTDLESKLVWLLKASGSAPLTTKGYTGSLKIVAGELNVASIDINSGIIRQTFYIFDASDTKLDPTTAHKITIAFRIVDPVTHKETPISQLIIQEMLKPTSSALASTFQNARLSAGLSNPTETGFFVNHMDQISDLLLADNNAIDAWFKQEFPRIQTSLGLSTTKRILGTAWTATHISIDTSVIPGTSATIGGTEYKSVIGPNGQIKFLDPNSKIGYIPIVISIGTSKFTYNLIVEFDKTTQQYELERAINNLVKSTTPVVDMTTIMTELRKVTALANLEFDPSAPPVIPAGSEVDASNAYKNALRTLLNSLNISTLTAPGEVATDYDIRVSFDPTIVAPTGNSNSGTGNLVISIVRKAHGSGSTSVPESIKATYKLPITMHYAKTYYEYILDRLATSSEANVKMTTKANTDSPNTGSLLGKFDSQLLEFFNNIPANLPRPGSLATESSKIGAIFSPESVNIDKKDQTVSFTLVIGESLAVDKYIKDMKAYNNDHSLPLPALPTGLHVLAVNSMHIVTAKSINEEVLSNINKNTYNMDYKDALTVLRDSPTKMDELINDALKKEDYYRYIGQSWKLDTSKPITWSPSTFDELTRTATVKIHLNVTGTDETGTNPVITPITLTLSLTKRLLDEYNRIEAIPSQLIVNVDSPADIVSATAVKQKVQESLFLKIIEQMRNDANGDNAKLLLVPTLSDLTLLASKGAFTVDLVDSIGGVFDINSIPSTALSSTFTIKFTWTPTASLGYLSQYVKNSALTIKFRYSKEDMDIIHSFTPMTGFTTTSAIPANSSHTLQDLAEKVVKDAHIPTITDKTSEQTVYTALLAIIKDLIPSNVQATIVVSAGLKAGDPIVATLMLTDKKDPSIKSGAVVIPGLGNYPQTATPTNTAPTSTATPGTKAPVSVPDKMAIESADYKDINAFIAALFTGKSPIPTIASEITKDSAVVAKELFKQFLSFTGQTKFPGGFNDFDYTLVSLQSESGVKYDVSGDDKELVATIRVRTTAQRAANEQGITYTLHINLEKSRNQLELDNFKSWVDGESSTRSAIHVDASVDASAVDGLGIGILATEQSKETGTQLNLGQNTLGLVKSIIDAWSKSHGAGFSEADKLFLNANLANMKVTLLNYKRPTVDQNTITGIDPTHGLKIRIDLGSAFIEIPITLVYSRTINQEHIDAITTQLTNEVTPTDKTKATVEAVEIPRGVVGTLNGVQSQITPLNLAAMLQGGGLTSAQIKTLLSTGVLSGTLSETWWTGGAFSITGASTIMADGTTYLASNAMFNGLDKSNVSFANLLANLNRAGSGYGLAKLTLNIGGSSRDIYFAFKFTKNAWYFR